jgi:transcriptional regulator with XRE-family HTH domain
MATLSSQLSSQLLKYLRKHPDVTQKEVAEYLNLSPSFLSEIISGKKNLNAPAAMKLSQFLEKPAAAADPTVRQFSFKGKKLTSHLEHVRFRDNDGFVPGQSGIDPYDPTGNAIDNAPDAVTAEPSFWDQDLIDTLREARGYHRKAVRAINVYINKAKAAAGITVPSGVTQKFGPC